LVTEAERVLFAPMLMLVFCILVLMLFAAFCAADIMDEKKPPPPAPPELAVGVGTDSPLSRLGEGGTTVKLDSLLGPSGIASDLARRCTFMLCAEDETPLDLVGEPVLLLLHEFFESEEASPMRLRVGSVGVGGVFTMAGALVSRVGGVLGGLPVALWERGRFDGLLGEAAGLATGAGSVTVRARVSESADPSRSNCDDESVKVAWIRACESTCVAWTIGDDVVR
jgi:hypothetical protein